MRKLLVLFIGVLGLLLTATPAEAQQTMPIPADKLATNNLDLRPFTGVWIDTASTASYATIDQVAKLSPFPSGPLRTQSRHPAIWLRVQLQNPHPTDTLHRLFFGGYHLSWGLGQLDAKKRLTVVESNGWLVKKSGPGIVDPFTLPVNVPPGQTCTVWFQTTGYSFFSAITPRLFTPAGYERFRQVRAIAQRNHFGYCCLIIGICLFLSVFAGVQSAYTRDVTYVYWSIYLAATCLFFLLTTDLGFNWQLIRPPIVALIVPIQYLIEIAYLLFLRSFLKLNQHIPRLNRLIYIAVWCLAVTFGISFWGTLNVITSVIEFTDQLFILTEILVLFIFVAVSRAKVSNRHLFIVGSLGLIAMAGVASIMNELGQTDFDHFWPDPTVWFSFGVVFELICFNLALSQRARLSEREKQRLEHEKALENQRLHLITEEFQQRIAETEMAGLRSQMNPHFIFNCLNSIQYFTAQNDAEKASNYLTKFSRLIRLVLENSKSERVTLANELETLRLYIEMEAMRFQQKVSYIIEVANEIDTESIQIPPLLLQPFVENAIWHGLMHKEEGGLVQVTVEQPQANLLHIEITDNGVGRAKATEYKSKSATQTKSFGMKLTADRIDLINQLYHTHTQVEILDLTDKMGIAAGTTVIINIPITYR